MRSENQNFRDRTSHLRKGDIKINNVSRKIAETDLPGIGKKYTLDLGDRGSLVVVILNTGKRELYLMSRERDDETCSFSIELSEDESKDLGLILAGALYETVKPEKIELVLKEVVMEWVKVERNSELANKTIAELQIRKKTGVSVIAVDRGGKIIPSPDPYTEKIIEGDKLIIVGTRNQLKIFRDTYRIS